MLVIKRKREFITWAKLFHIYIDGQMIGIVSNGQTEEFEISEGDHKIKAKCDWCGSNELSFSVSENQEQTITISAFKLADFFIFLGLGIIFLHSFLQKNYGVRHVIWLSVPFFLWTLYHMTFGYKKFLHLEEDKFSLSFK